MEHQCCNRAGRRVARPFSGPPFLRASTLWKDRRVLALCLLAALSFTGCTSTEVTSPQMVVIEKPFRPSRILVRDIAATTADIPADAPVGARIAAGVSISPEQIAKDRQLGADMAAQLVASIRAMGLPAERALAGVAPQTNDVVISGCFVSMNTNGTAKRFTVGCDLSASELMTIVESFQITAQGLGRNLGRGTAMMGGDETLGGAAGAAAASGLIVTSRLKINGGADARARLEGWARQSVKEIADRLKTEFQEQGWIEKRD